LSRDEIHQLIGMQRRLRDVVSAEVESGSQEFTNKPS
jgi:hypothetical protein